MVAEDNFTALMLGLFEIDFYGIAQTCIAAIIGLWVLKLFFSAFGSGNKTD